MIFGNPQAAPCVIVHRWQCFKCGRLETSRSHPYYRNCELPTPCLPEGWTEAGRGIYCEAHTVEIVIKVDGEQQ